MTFWYCIILDREKVQQFQYQFMDCLVYYNAFDEYHEKHDLSAMEKLLGDISTGGLICILP